MVCRCATSGRGCSVTTRGDDGLHGRAGERRVSGQHLVGDAPQRVDVGTRGEVALAHGLLGTHVGWGAERHAGLGHPGAAGAARGERDAEVGDDCATIVQEDVLRLDVAVDHSVAMGIVERAGDLGRYAYCIAERELLLAGEARAEGLALDVGHDVEQQVVGRGSCTAVVGRGSWVGREGNRP